MKICTMTVERFSKHSVVSLNYELFSTLVPRFPSGVWIKLADNLGRAGAELEA